MRSIIRVWFGIKRHHKLALSIFQLQKNPERYRIIHTTKFHQTSRKRPLDWVVQDDIPMWINIIVDEVNYIKKDLGLI
jgi:hypothetical protein